MSIRKVERTLRADVASDGDGVRLRRAFPTQSVLQLDPFLLFDEFGSDKPADYRGGFPDHPHRGFETVTYMLAGRMRHFDNAGNSGLLVSGAAQWMTAGRGLIHSEMPEQQEGLMRGFQIWVNLPAAEKMVPPRYQDYAPEMIPTARVGEGVEIKVVAGSVVTPEGRVTGPVDGVSRDPLLLDVSLAAGASWSVDIPDDHTALAHVFEGVALVGETLIPRFHMAVLGPGDTVHLAAQEAAARVLLLAARPIGEPVARAGPFVMNTREEILQAFQDYQNGVLG